MDRDHTLKGIKTVGIIIAVLLLLNLLLHLKNLKKTPELPIPKVTIQTPKQLKVTEYITQTGTTVAYNSVNLVARVQGFLDVISFVDGTIVKKDTPLFVIEPQPYLEQLREAQATVAAQKANLVYAKAEYARQKRMYKDHATSLNNVEIWMSKTEEAEANVAKAVANAEVAAINYSYTHIKAPFDGRIGRHLVDIGNLVGNGVATNLATIQQIDPLYVYFNLNELDLIRLRDAARAQGMDASKIKEIPVGVNMQNETGYPHSGTLDFVNTSLNASTGTLEFRALLKNKDYTLLPGLFVQVRVAVTQPTLQFTVPDTAVLYDQIGAYVLVVDNTNHVQLKRVELGSLEQGIRAISKGITAQDNVIVSGLQSATPGNLVEPQVQKSNA